MDNVGYGLLGIFLGVVTIVLIEILIGNPFIWIEDKIRERKK